MPDISGLFVLVIGDIMELPHEIEDLVCYLGGEFRLGKAIDDIDKVMRPGLVESCADFPPDFADGLLDLVTIPHRLFQAAGGFGLDVHLGEFPQKMLHLPLLEEQLGRIGKMHQLASAATRIIRTGRLDPVRGIVLAGQKTAFLHLAEGKDSLDRRPLPREEIRDENGFSVDTDDASPEVVQRVAKDVNPSFLHLRSPLSFRPSSPRRGKAS